MCIKRKTLEEFISDAKKVHGDKYDYSLVKEYMNNKTNVVIRCNSCGNIFHQTPHAHLSGQGCPKCGIKKNVINRTGNAVLSKRRKIFGVGVNDYEYSTRINGKRLTSYTKWYNMLARCYSKEWKKNKPTYDGCTVCDEWLYYSNFKRWYDKNGRDGYDVDKDILVKGNKIYSPNTCCCVPTRINSLLINRKNDRGKYPIGVSCKNNHFTGSVSIGNGKSIYIGWYKSKEEAFKAYKSIKESYIKRTAQDFFNDGLIDENVYNALMNYKIEITD